MTRTTIAVLMMLALGAGMAGAQGTTRAPAAKETIEAPVNLNTTTATQLEMLPGRRSRDRAADPGVRQKSGGFKEIDAAKVSV